MWKLATDNDDSNIVRLCQQLYLEDPSSEPDPSRNMGTTLKQFRLNPVRGKAVVLELNDKIEGYSVLLSFWSNELGGEICIIDELYITPSHRSQGYGTQLIKLISKKDVIWPNPVVGIQLEVSPKNTRARALYSREGFQQTRNATLRLRPS